MRKSLIVVMLIVFLACSNAFAGGVGNCLKPIGVTTDSDIGSGLGFEINYVHSRDKLDNKYGPRRMIVEEISQIYGKTTIGLGDSFNLYAKIGTCDYKLEFVEQTAREILVEVGMEDGIYTGVGINTYFPAIKGEYFDIGIGGDMQCNFYANPVKSMTRGGVQATGLGGSFYGLDGQNSLYVTCEFDVKPIKTLVVPYIGAFHSWIAVGTLESLQYETPATGYLDTKDYQAAYDMSAFGLLLGVDLDICKYGNLNIEGRFGGEEALTAGATIKF